MKDPHEVGRFAFTEQQREDTGLPECISLAETAGALSMILTQIEGCDAVIDSAWHQRPAPNLGLIIETEARQGRLEVLREALVDSAARAFPDIVEQVYLGQDTN